MVNAANNLARCTLSQNELRPRLDRQSPGNTGSFPHAATVSGRGECVAGAGGFRTHVSEVKSGRCRRSRRRPAHGRMLRRVGSLRASQLQHSSPIPHQDGRGSPKNVNFAAAPTGPAKHIVLPRILRCDHRVMPTLECLGANGFPEAAERIDQPHIHKELKDIADAARKQAVGLSTERPD